MRAVHIEGPMPVENNSSLSILVEPVERLHFIARLH